MMETNDVVEVISVSSGSSSNKSSILVALNNHQKYMERRRLLKSPINEVKKLISQSKSSALECRYPIIRDNANKMSANTFCTPSPTCKVTSWLQKNLNELTPPIAANLSENPPDNSLPFLVENRNLDCPLELLNKALDNRFTNKTSILVRQDYKKQTEVCEEKVDENRPVSTITDSPLKTVNTNVVCTQTNGQTGTEPGKCRCPTDHHPTKSIKNNNVRRKNKFTTASIIPLSPESQKKNELCEYLKLMNMNLGDATASARRSSRVRHLALMSKKKELEKQLNTESSDSEKRRSLKVSERRESRQSTESNNTKVSTRKSSETSSEPDVLIIENHSDLEETVQDPERQLEPTETNPNMSRVFLALPVPETTSDFDKCVLKEFRMEIRDKLRRKNAIRKNSKRPRRHKPPNKVRNNVKRKLLFKPNGLLKAHKKNKQSKQVTTARWKHLKLLRSQGHLKTVDLDKILLRQERRRRVRKTLTNGIKSLKETELKKNVEYPEPQQTRDVNKNKTLKQQKHVVSPVALKKLDMLKLELDLLQNLTPEHRKALSESKRFLNLPKTDPTVDGRDEEKSQTQSNAETTNKTIEGNSNKASETSQHSSEDTEVGLLMSKQANGEIKRTVTSARTVQHSTTELTSFADLSSSVASSSSSYSSSSKPLQSEPPAPTPSSSLSKCKTASTPVSTHSKTNDSRNVSANGLVSPLSSSLPHPRLEVVNISDIQPTKCDYVQLLATDESEMKSLHQCLTEQKRKHVSPLNTTNVKHSWENDTEEMEQEKSPRGDRKSRQSSHIIRISTERNGRIMNTFYLDYNLVVVQESAVSFWYQTPLGNVLGAQDMWISKGSIRRSILGNGCVHKESTEMVISLENSVAYVELWTKEHKSDKREQPVADIFVAIYLRTNRNVPEKKVLQLENIRGYPSDVQYIVLRSSRNIVVSWSVTDGNNSSSTVIHCYQLSPDFQIVTSIKEIQSVDHYLSSLHNIEDCDTLIMGCGDSKITLWNLEYSYVVATIELTGIHPQPRTFCAKCDRGFLFTLQQLEDGLLQLIAINSFDSTWKRLQTYKTEFETHQSLRGVCMDRGLIVAFFDVGITCWKAKTGELVFEDLYEEGIFLPSGNHVVIILNNRIYIRHTLEYLVTIDDL